LKRIAGNRQTISNVYSIERLPPPFSKRMTLPSPHQRPRPHGRDSKHSIKDAKINPSCVRRQPLRFLIGRSTFHFLRLQLRPSGEIRVELRLPTIGSFPCQKQADQSRDAKNMHPKPRAIGQLRPTTWLGDRRCDRGFVLAADGVHGISITPAFAPSDAGERSFATSKAASTHRDHDRPSTN
jgi:hypothetical protein